MNLFFYEKINKLKFNLFSKKEKSRDLIAAFFLKLFWILIFQSLARVDAPARFDFAVKRVDFID